MWARYSVRKDGGCYGSEHRRYEGKLARNGNAWGNRYRAVALSKAHSISVLRIEASSIDLTTLPTKALATSPRTLSTSPSTTFHI